MSKNLEHKLNKLLRLSESSNIHEAKSALDKAESFIIKHGMHKKNTMFDMYKDRYEARLSSPPPPKPKPEDMRVTINTLTLRVYTGHLIDNLAKWANFLYSRPTVYTFCYGFTGVPELVQELNEIMNQESTLIELLTSIISSAETCRDAEILSTYSEILDTCKTTSEELKGDSECFEHLTDSHRLESGAYYFRKRDSMLETCRAMIELKIVLDTIPY